MKITRERAAAWLLPALMFLLARGALHRTTFSLPLSNDDAIPMIQAGLLLRGEPATTLINQPYNGTLDSWLLAPALVLASPHTVFRLYEILSGAALVVACAVLARRVAGPRAGVWAAVLAAMGSPYMSLMTAVGPVPNFIVPVLVTVALGLLWRNPAPGAGHGLAAGLIVGLATWDSALTLPPFAGAVAGLIWLRAPLRRAAPGLAAGFALGLAPAVIARMIGAAGETSVTALRPMWLWREGAVALARAAAGLFGVSVPLVVDGPERAPLPLVLAIVLATVLAALVAFGVGRRSAPVVGWGVALAAAFALSRRTGPDEVRYLYGLTVPVLVLAGVALDRLARGHVWAPYVAVAPVLAGWAFGHLELLRHWRDPRHAAVVWQVPPLAPALELLTRRGLTGAYASLQFAGRLTLESGGGVVASQAWNERIPGDPLRFRDEVDLDPHAAWVLSPRWSRGMPRAAGFRAALSEMGGRWREEAAGDVIVFDAFAPPFDEARPVSADEMLVFDSTGENISAAVLDRRVATFWRSAAGISRGSSIAVRVSPSRRLEAIVLAVDVERSPLAVPWVATVDGEIVARGPRRYGLQWVAGVPRAGKQALLAVPLPGRPAMEVRVTFQGSGPPLALSEVFVYGPDEAPRAHTGEEPAAQALAAARAGRWREAVRLYEDAARAEPDRAEYHAGLIRARWRAAHRQFLDVESLDDGGPEIVVARP